MNKVNYQKELEKLLGCEENYGKRLLLHSCCAPCSSYCLRYLREFFRITVFYYNPNITEKKEYEKREAEEKRLIEIYNKDEASGFTIDVMDAPYDPGRFTIGAQGLEDEPEGGKRCEMCFRLRLSVCGEYALREKYDFFGTTLTISPLKNEQLINEIGLALSREIGVSYLVSDFKKKNGYKESVELSKKYDLYRQNYCGCIYSRISREREKHEIFS